MMASELVVDPVALLAMIVTPKLPLLAGVPVIASDHGGLRETVPFSSGGRFPVGDDAALAGRIEQLLDDDRRWRDVSRSADSGQPYPVEFPPDTAS